MIVIRMIDTMILLINVHGVVIRVCMCVCVCVFDGLQRVLTNVPSPLLSDWIVSSIPCLIHVNRISISITHSYHVQKNETGCVLIRLASIFFGPVNGERHTRRKKKEKLFQIEIIAVYQSYRSYIFTRCIIRLLSSFSCMRLGFV